MRTHKYIVKYLYVNYDFGEFAVQWLQLLSLCFEIVNKLLQNIHKTSNTFKLSLCNVNFKSFPMLQEEEILEEGKMVGLDGTIIQVNYFISSITSGYATSGLLEFLREVHIFLQKEKG